MREMVEKAGIATTMALAVAVPGSQNKWAPILSAISTLACLIIGSLAVRYQIPAMVYATIGIGFSALHLINTFLVPKIKNHNPLPFLPRPTAPGDSASKSERQKYFQLKREYAEYEDGNKKIEELNQQGKMMNGLQKVKQIYGVATFIIMTILYSLTMSGHISLYAMGITTLTFTSFTFMNIIGLLSYKMPSAMVHPKELYEDEGKNLWEPWKYTCCYPKTTT